MVNYDIQPQKISSPAEKFAKNVKKRKADLEKELRETHEDFKPRAKNELLVLEAEEKYTKEYIEENPGNIELLAAHGTELDKAAFALLIGKILPGFDAQILWLFFMNKRMATSPIPTNSISLSAEESNPQYSIKKYPENVSRPWTKCQGEIFFATKLKSILESKSFAGFNSNEVTRKITCTSFFLTGKNGLIALAKNHQIDIPVELKSDPANLQKRLLSGELTNEEYLAILQLARQLGVSTGGDQPFRELTTNDHLEINNQGLLFMPDDFKPAFIAELIEVVRKMAEIDKLSDEQIMEKLKQYFWEDDDNIINIVKIANLIKELKQRYLMIKANKPSIEELISSFVIFYNHEIPTGNAALRYFSNKKRSPFKG